MQEGAVALWRVEEHVFDLLPVQISRGGLWQSVDLDAGELHTKDTRKLVKSTQKS